jgi:zinc finger CCHC domain-containing protein 9
MTRYTNLGRKRTYVQAGFNDTFEGQSSAGVSAGASTQAPENSTSNANNDSVGSTKKKRKRSKPKKQNIENVGDDHAPKGEEPSNGGSMAANANGEGWGKKEPKANVTGWKRDKSLLHSLKVCALTEVSTCESEQTYHSVLPRPKNVD